MLRLALSLSLCAAVAHAAPPVAFCAPPELRKPLAAALTAQGHQPLDLSEIDQALFGPKGARAVLAAGKQPTLAATLPAELNEDFAKGLAGCKARAKQDASARRACADHLVGAVWERHLQRLRPARVIELKPMELLGDGSVLLGTYRAGDPVLAVIPWPDASAKSVSEMVEAAMKDELPATGVRPNTTELPTRDPLPPPDLSQGAPQRPEALPMPTEFARCQLPAKLSVTPASVPLGVTIAALWEATAKNNPQSKAPAASCSLELGPRALLFHCGSEVSQVELFEGTPLGDSALQAALARRFVELKLDASCR